MDDQPDPTKLLQLARKTMSSAERRRKDRQADFWGPTRWYPTQLSFLAAGSSGVHQRLVYGGNQVGKTWLCAFEAGACHLTGNYPDWWTGLRYNKPIRAWATGESSQLVRDTLQAQLCGRDELGTGTIPLESFVKKPVMIPGGTGAIDTIFVAHCTDGKPDGVSTLTFKSFEMRREKLQSETVDLIWIDEKPSEEIYSELLARTSACNGHIIVSFTPVGEGGASGITYRFLSEPSSDRAVFRIPGHEAKHISPERREELAQGYTDAERETRLEGVPQLGTGPVFPIELLPTIIKSFDPEEEVPSWARLIVGIDFGFDHPFAAVLIAWAHDLNRIWVTDCFRMERSTPLYHVQRIHSMTRGLKVPIAWPHDGATDDKGSGLTLSGQYKQFGAAMLPSHAVNHGTVHNYIEPALEEIRAMMYEGRITIAPHCGELIDEIRHYHRDEDYRIVKQRDDLVSAMRYAIMMRRSGKPRDAIDGIGFGNMPFAGQRADQRYTPQLAKNADFNVFSGEAHE